MDTLANNNSGRQQTDGSPFLDNSKLSDAERVRRVKLANQARRDREKLASDKATFLRTWKRKDEFFAQTIVSLMDQAETGIDEGQQLSLLPEEEGAADESTPAPAPVVIDRPAWYPHLASLELAPVTLEELGAPAEARRLLTWLAAQKKTPRLTPEVLTSALPELGEAERREALCWLALCGYVRQWTGSRGTIDVQFIDGPIHLADMSRLIGSFLDGLPQAPALVPLVNVQRELLVPREWLDAVVDQLVARGSLRCTTQEGVVQIGWQERNAKIERLLLVLIEQAGGKLMANDASSFLQINGTEIRRALARLHAAGEVSIQNSLVKRIPKDQRAPLAAETLDPTLLLQHVSTYGETSVQRLASSALLPESLVGEACAALAKAGKLNKAKKPSYSSDAGPWYQLPKPSKKTKAKAKAPAKGKASKGKKSPPSKATKPAKPARATAGKATPAKASKPTRATSTKASKPARATSTKATPAAAPAPVAPAAAAGASTVPAVLAALRQSSRRRSAKVLATLLGASELAVQVALDALVAEGLVVGARRGGYQIKREAPAAAAPQPPAKPRRGGKAAPAAPPARVARRAPVPPAPASRRAPKGKAPAPEAKAAPCEPWADVLNVVVQQLALAEGRPVRVDALHEKTGLPAEQLTSVLNLLEQCEAIEQAYGVWSPCVDLDRFTLLAELPKWLHDKICNLLDDNDGDITHQRVAGWLEAPEGLVLTVLRGMLALHLVREQEGLWLPAKASPPEPPPAVPTEPRTATATATATAAAKAPAAAPRGAPEAAKTATATTPARQAAQASAQERTLPLIPGVTPAPEPDALAPAPPAPAAPQAVAGGQAFEPDLLRQVWRALGKAPWAFSALRRMLPEYTMDAVEDALLLLDAADLAECGDGGWRGRDCERGETWVLRRVLDAVLARFPREGGQSEQKLARSLRVSPETVHTVLALLGKAGRAKADHEGLWSAIAPAAEEG